MPKQKPHVHAEVIKAWAEGAEIEYFAKPCKCWVIAPFPKFSENLEYRVKPEPVFPKSTLYFIADNIISSGSVLDAYKQEIADAAIREFIESGEMQKYIDSPK